jgi:dTDP-glucose 4,6-dehydratase
MVSVLDCVTAVENALDKEIPNKNYNLGSKNPPTVEELLSRLIESVGSKSRLVKTPAWLVKGVLKVLESIGVPLLYKEQYMIADVNYQVDISSTENELGWVPRYNDQDMIYQAYKEYKRLALRLPHN